ncbi:MAG: PilZ domain-containing protein [Gammaproteobacteria bacterium]|nr:PilZ domain-containing protein [Gammaproteobacteria bacterium]
MENRRHPRNPIAVMMKVWHPQFGEKLVTTRDLSDGGLFIVCDPATMPAMGEILDGQVQSEHAELPIVKMEIVRAEKDGLGLRFVGT